MRILLKSKVWSNIWQSKEVVQYMKALKEVNENFLKGFAGLILSFFVEWIPQPLKG
jgi:hypothetical protein